MNRPLPPSPSRRDFISTLALAGVALPLAGRAAAQPAASAAAAMATPGASAPTRIHVFAKPLQWLDYDGTAELLAETGYGGIDYAVRPGGHVLPEKVADDLPRAVEAARKHGLAVEMITTAIVDAHDRHTEPLLKTAAQLGVKFYRLGYFSYDPKLSVTESWARQRAVMKDLAAINQHYGLQGAYQNHVGSRIGSAVWDLHELLRDLDPRWVGCQYDVRHAVAEGGQSWPNALRLLAPWIRCTDLKDFHWVETGHRATPESVPLGEGVVNFDAYFKLVRELGIAGPASVHFEYPPFERVKSFPSAAEKRAQFAAALKKDLAAVKGYYAKHGLV